MQCFFRYPSASQSTITSKNTDIIELALACTVRIREKKWPSSFFIDRAAEVHRLREKNETNIPPYGPNKVAQLNVSL